MKNELWAACGILVIVAFLGVTFGHGYRLYHRYFVTDTSNTFQVDKEWFLFNSGAAGAAGGLGYGRLQAGAGAGGVRRAATRMFKRREAGAAAGGEQQGDRALLDQDQEGSAAEKMVHMGQYGGAHAQQGEAPTPDAAAFTCQNCGTGVSPSFRFCPRCKHDLRSL